MKWFQGYACTFVLEKAKPNGIVRRPSSVSTVKHRCNNRMHRCFLYNGSVFFLDANKALITFILFTSLMMNGTFPKFKTCLLRIYSAGNYVIGWRFYLIWHFVIKSLSAQINMTNDMKVNIHYIRSLSICPAETGKSMLSTRIFFKKSSKFDVTKINGDKNVLDAQIILKSLDALSNSPNFDLIGVHLSC